MKISIETAKRIMDENGGSLNLSGTGITALPDNLTVGGGARPERHGHHRIGN